MAYYPVVTRGIGLQGFIHHVLTPEQFIRWFRDSAPYINAHRGKTFVVYFPGEAARVPTFTGLIHDISLLGSLGVRLVLVHGARPQIDEALRTGGLDGVFHDAVRVTDEVTMASVKQVVGAMRLDIEAALSMGVANSPMAGACNRIAGGNFVTARPVGVVDGIDHLYTGQVRRIDTEAINRRLDDGDIVLLSPLAHSVTGETFNLHSLQVATSVAIELRAAKLIVLHEDAVMRDVDGQLIRQLTVDQAADQLKTLRRSDASKPAANLLAEAIHACRNGVTRAHMLDPAQDGALLHELFTRDGLGTLVSAGRFDQLRRAVIADVGGILELIEPLEASGVLVRRSREKLEREIERYTVMERDGMVVACASVYPFVDEQAAELACLAVHADYHHDGRGSDLLNAIEGELLGQGIERLFVLTTQSAHWFQERGFTETGTDALPVSRKRLYNWQRRSKVLVKSL